MGLLIRVAFEVFWGKHAPGVKDSVQTFGTPDAHGPSYTLLEEYRCLLRKVTGAGVDLKPKCQHGAQSPLQASLLQAWLRKAGEPETSLKEWILEGVPLGVERPIPCHGVYPPNSNPKVCGVRDARQAGTTPLTTT